MYNGSDAARISSAPAGAWFASLPGSGAVRTDILHFPARVVVTPLPIILEESERSEETADDHFHADYGPPAAALRPPASESRPTNRGRDHRHGSRGPSLDGARVAGPGADGRGLPRWCGPHGAGTPTGAPEAAATRPEARGAAPARAGPATDIRVSPHRRAPAGRTRQDTDPARRGSGPRVCAAAGAPAVPELFSESVPCLAPTAARMCARGSVLLSSHIRLAPP